MGILMSEWTTHLKLPFLAAAQAQKHVTHNEALALVDLVVQLAVVSDSVNAPPADPDEVTATSCLQCHGHLCRT